MENSAVLAFAIPHTSQFCYIAVEPDQMDHEEVVMIHNGKSFGNVARRTKAHPRFDRAVQDALQVLDDEFVTQRHLRGSLTRDNRAGCFIGYSVG